MGYIVGDDLQYTVIYFPIRFSRHPRRNGGKQGMRNGGRGNGTSKHICRRVAYCIDCRVAPTVS